jgi:hypothetical protein
MKKTYLALLVVAMLAIACGGNEANKQDVLAKATKPVDAYRGFLRGLLDGNKTQADFFMLKDSTNNGLLDNWTRMYDRQEDAEKYQYKQATLQFYGTRNENDSTLYVAYANSYKNKQDTLKVIRTDGAWLVDFKYSFHFKQQ